MTDRKLTGADIVSLPSRIQELVAKNSGKSSFYSAYLWLDDEKALYLHGHTSTGRSTGGFQGKLASQIGTQYMVSLEAVLGDRTLIDGIQQVQIVQIESQKFNWEGSIDDLLNLVLED